VTLIAIVPGGDPEKFILGPTNYIIKFNDVGIFLGKNKNVVEEIQKCKFSENSEKEISYEISGPPPGLKLSQVKTEKKKKNFLLFFFFFFV
jgi:hypothetical protein